MIPHLNFPNGHQLKTGERSHPLSRGTTLREAHVLIGDLTRGGLGKPLGQGEAGLQTTVTQWCNFKPGEQLGQKNATRTKLFVNSPVPDFGVVTWNGGRRHPDHRRWLCAGHWRHGLRGLHRVRVFGFFLHLHRFLDLRFCIHEYLSASNCVKPILMQRGALLVLLHPPCQMLHLVWQIPALFCRPAGDSREIPELSP
jgi:hypothetical protein